MGACRARFFSKGGQRSGWLALATSLILVGLSPATAKANHPTDNVLEQRWELLAETALGVQASKNMWIERGTLPGGTTKFDPAPTVTLEVAGRHTGAAVQGNPRWEVQLRASNETLATVTFSRTDSAFTIRTATFPWPSGDRSLSRLRLERIDDGLNLAGSFDIHKAGLVLRQSGTVTKTVARVPIAVKQDAIINTDWLPVTEVIRYEHIAAEFDPPPTVKLRTTGMEKTQAPIPMSLHVRLVNASGQPVGGAETVHSGHGSKITGALSLTDTNYSLQVRVDSNIPPEEGRLDSADLVFEQATSDAHGITRTVGFYPSITAATDLSVDGAWADYRLRAPDVKAPGISWSLSASLRRLIGNGTVRAALQDRTAPHSPPPSVDTTQSTGTTTKKIDISLPTTVAGNDLDTKAILATGTTARVVQTLLRASVTLRDLFAPKIFYLTPIDRGNVSFASAPLAAKLTDYQGIDAAAIVFTLYDESTGTSQSFSGAQVTYNTLTGWAKTTPASFVQGHIYRLAVSARDVPGNLASVAHIPLTEGGGFLAVTASAGSAEGRIDPTPCTVSGGVATCPNVLLKVGASTATLSGAKSRGVGAVLHTISLEGAIIKGTLPDGSQVQQGAYVATDPAWGPRTMRSEFVVRDPFETQTALATRSASKAIGTLSTPVPAGWDSVTLELTTTSSVSLDACADATASSLVCVPDLVRFLLRGGTNTTSHDIRGHHRAVADGPNSVSAPLAAMRPTWVSDGYFDQLLGSPGGLQSPATSANETPLEFGGLRPGTIFVSGGYRCTVNFIFTRTIDGVEEYALGTAAHCEESAKNFVHFLRPDNLVAWDVAVGEAIVRGEGAANEAIAGEDFSLFLIPIGDQGIPEEWIQPAIYGLGGPCGQYHGDLLREVEWVGHGPTAAVGDGYDPPVPRGGTIYKFSQIDDPNGNPDATIEEFTMTGPTVRGDSGGPVRLASGEALGIAAKIGNLGGSTAGADVKGPRIKQILETINSSQDPDWVLMESCPA